MGTVRPFTVVNSKETDDQPLGNPLENAVITATSLLFGWQGRKTPILDIARFEIQNGEAVFIQGPSGSGKSTLLNLLAGVIIPQQGRVTVLGHGINTLHGSQRDRFKA